MKSKGRSRKPTRVERIDIAISEFLDPLRKTAPVKLAGPVAELGDQPPLYGVAGGVIAAAAAERDWRLMHAGARMLAAHVAATTAKTLLKLTIDRTRPPMAAENGRYEMRQGKRFEENYNSFPSGHTASSIAVARALGREYPGQHGAAFTAAGLVAALQVVRGKHFVGDILAGAALGFAVEKAVDLIFRPYPARV